MQMLSHRLASPDDRLDWARNNHTAERREMMSIQRDDGNVEALMRTTRQRHQALESFLSVGQPQNDAEGQSNDEQPVGPQSHLLVCSAQPRGTTKKRCTCGLSWGKNGKRNTTCGPLEIFIGAKRNH